MTARTARGDRARTEILATARTLLAEKGPDSFSLREVARRAGYAPAALYNHFSGIDELMTAVALEAIGFLGAYLGAVPEGPVYERLRGLGEAYVRFGQDHAEAYLVVFDRLVNPPHTWEEYLEVAHPFKIIVDECARGLAGGELADPAHVGAGGIAYSMWAYCHGHVRLRDRHLSRIEGDFDAMFASGLEALLSGYAPPRADARSTPHATARRKDPS